MYRERPSRIAGATLWRADGGGTSSILPDGCIDVLWWNERLIVAGPDERAHVSQTAPGSITLGIRFAPGTAPGYLGLPAHAVTNQRVELGELWSRDVMGRLESSLRTESRRTESRRTESSASGSPGTAQHFEQLIAHGLRVPDARRARQARALASAVATGLSVTEIAERTGYSARQLQRRSREDFGYGLGTLSRILRLQDALPLVRSQQPFAQVAANAGYSDQAHLSREVRALSGMTPTALRASTKS